MARALKSPPAGKSLLTAIVPPSPSSVGPVTIHGMYKGFVKLPPKNLPRWGWPRTQLQTPVRSLHRTPAIRRTARLPGGRPHGGRFEHIGVGSVPLDDPSRNRAGRSAYHYTTIFPKTFETRIVLAHPWQCLRPQPRRLQRIPSVAWTLGICRASRSSAAAWAF